MEPTDWQTLMRFVTDHAPNTRKIREKTPIDDDARRKILELLGGAAPNSARHEDDKKDKEHEHTVRHEHGDKNTGSVMELKEGASASEKGNLSGDHSAADAPAVAPPRHDSEREGHTGNTVGARGGTGSASPTANQSPETEDQVEARHRVWRAARNLLQHAVPGGWAMTSPTLANSPIG
jgi:hypothetical protein